MKKNKIKFILLFIFTNVSIYLCIVVNLNFLFLLFNGLLFYVIYEFDRKKIESKSSNKDKNPINPYDLPASEHPIIKSAKNRLKKKVNIR